MKRIIGTTRYKQNGSVLQIPEQTEERLLPLTGEWLALYGRCVDVFSWVLRKISEIREAVRLLENAAKSQSAASVKLLQGESVLRLSAGYDYAAVLPGIIRYSRGKALPISPEVLFCASRSALISGPPGSGKTSFCRWETIKAVDRFSSDWTQPIPVYVPANKLASMQLRSFEETFLGASDFLNVWAGSTSNKISIRLFLDGLDEVPDREQQRRIIELLREGLDRYPALTITVTSRPYIWGTWLNWMPRFHIAELTGRDQRKLAANWLEDDEQVAKFFKQLEQSPALQKLMGTPLLATLILNLYRRTPRIPENKASLYRAFVDLYCGGWDTAKGGFQRGQYHTEQKLRPLAALAYRMHLSNTPECSEQMFMQAVRATMPRFVEKGADFLTEVVQDGILVRAGRDLLFSHLSFQEYLAAQYLASDPTGERARRALRLFLEGEDWWKEVVEFFIISRDDPAAVSDWISRTARATLGRGGAESADLRRRLQLLAISVEETFPGYKPSFDLFRRWSRDD